MSGPHRSWDERQWRNMYAADVARGLVAGAAPFYTHGELVTSGSATEAVIWEPGMPNSLTVPDNIQLTIVSSSASDTGRITIRYLDGNLIERTETVTLNGTTSVTTTADDIRAINNAYSLDGAVVGNITISSGGTTYARIPAGNVQFNTSLQRIPAGKRLMITSIYGGSASGSSAARVVIKLQTTQINGDSFAEDGVLHPVGAVAVQDSSVTLANFGPFPISAGEWVGFTATTDKAADITAGLFGWLEPA
jgi:hypothetical protein